MRRLKNLAEMSNQIPEYLVRLIRLSEVKLGRKPREGEFEKLVSMKTTSSRPSCDMPSRTFRISEGSREHRMQRVHSLQ
jgi:hypothetical protein